MHQSPRDNQHRQDQSTADERPLADISVHSGDEQHHPIPSGLVLFVAAVYGYVGERTFVGGALVLSVLVVAWRLVHRGSFDKVVWFPLMAMWRGWWIYKRHWHATMAVTGLAVVYQDEEYVPAIVRVSCGRHVDRVIVDMVSGQAP